MTYYNGKKNKKNCSNNYPAKKQKSRAKARSQSAPKSRPDSYERQPSRRRASIEGRNVPKPVRMQRSSSHVGVTAQNYQYPCSIKLDRSIVSECGSTSTVLTNTNSNYCTWSMKWVLLLTISHVTRSHHKIEWYCNKKKKKTQKIMYNCHWINAKSCHWVW